MKAILLTQYGPPEALQIADVPKPTPREHEVLVKIHATAINDYDWGMVLGEPRIYQLLFGIGKPRQPIPGMELSGVVEAVGRRVTKFKGGDAVYGDTSEYGFGSFAEYVCVNEKALVLKPEAMTFEEAASVSHASMLAYQGLVDMGKIKPQQKILINGAGGGVGMFGLQLAKLYDAEVTGVDTSEKLDAMKAQGFDHVMDYKTTDFTKTCDRYDLILDTKTTRSPFAHARALKPGGIYTTVGGTPGKLIQTLLLGWMASLSGSKKIRLVALKPNKDLSYINELFEAGKLKCLIDGPYPFDKIPWAIRYFGEGKHKGKVVIKVL